MSRRSLLVTALCAALLLPSAAAAQDPAPDASGEPALDPSPEPTFLLDPSAEPTFPLDPSAEPTFLLDPTAEPALESSLEPTAAPRPSAKPKPKVDFKVGKWKPRRIKWKNLRFNNGTALPPRVLGPQDAKAIPMRPLGSGGRLVYNPTVLAQQGMKRLDSYRLTGNKYHLRQARKYAKKLDDIAGGGKKRRWQPHWYHHSVLHHGWVNSNSHGLTLSFFVRLYEIGGDKKRLDEAAKLMAAYERRPKHARWFSYVTIRDYLWFEHWPDGNHDRTLNAHLNALFGLYDYWRVTGDPLAKTYFLGGAKTVRDKLYRFRRKGELSRYSLSGDVASLHYHETHIEQLRTLSKMLGDPWFDKQADRFEQDELLWKIKYRGARP